MISFDAFEGVQCFATGYQNAAFVMPLT